MGKKKEGTQDSSILHALLPEDMSSHSTSLEIKPLTHRPSGPFNSLTIAYCICCSAGLCSSHSHRIVQEIELKTVLKWLWPTCYTHSSASLSISCTNYLSPVPASGKSILGRPDVQLHALAKCCGRQRIKTVHKHKATLRLAFHGRSEHTVEDI